MTDTQSGSASETAAIGDDYAPQEHTTSVSTYFGDRIRVYETFTLGLINPNPQYAMPAGRPFAEAIEGTVSVEKLKENLRQLGRQGDHLPAPKLLTVHGTFFPCVLLTTGWWERQGNRVGGGAVFRDQVQEWLFRGFDLWAPSWDVSLAAEAESGASAHILGQLGSGDEAESIPVLIPRAKARVARGLLGDAPVMAASVTGLLKHVSHLTASELEALESGSGRSTDEASADDEPSSEYCLVLDDEERLHGIGRLGDQADLYSGYLWQCWGPRASLDQAPRVQDVYFIWEHTNFSSPDAVKYNLDSLVHKVEHLMPRIDDPVLMQKSHSVLVPGIPALSSQHFYDLLSPSLRR
jgi:hypothetical protein